MVRISNIEQRRTDISWLRNFQQQWVNTAVSLQQPIQLPFLFRPKEWLDSVLGEERTRGRVVGR